jgi:hypothetical protein
VAPPAPPEAPSAAPRRPPLGRGRIALLTILVILSCLALVVSTTIAWTHQTVLSSDRYVTIVGRISSEPVVIERVSLRLARQAVLAADVEGRIAAVLPDPADFIATTIADQIEAALATRLAELFASPGFQSAWLEANRALHQQVVAFLRGETSVIQAEDGVVTLDLYQLVIRALLLLQEQGVIGPDVAIPQPDDPAGRDALIARLETALGRDLPEDFGLVPVVSSERLASAQSLLRWFDIVTVLAIVATALLLVVTVVVAGVGRRMRMAVVLALAAVGAIAIARLAVGILEDALVSAVAAPGGEPTVRALYEDLVVDLLVWLQILLVAGVAVAVVAYLVSRPAWLMRAVGGGEAEAGAGRWPSLSVEAVFVSMAAVVGALLLWLVSGPEIAILVSLLVGGIAYLAASRLRRREPAAPEPPPA